MLSGGARCRQTARHLATSRVTSLVLRAPAAPSPARRQPNPACGPEAVTLRPSRQPPAEVRGVPSPLPGPLIPGLGADCLPGGSCRGSSWPCAFAGPAAVAWCRACGRDPREPETRLRVWCGAWVRVQLSGRWTLHTLRDPSLRPEVPPPPLLSPQWAEGAGRGLFKSGALRAPLGRAGAQAGHLGFIAVCFAARPELRAPVGPAATHPSPAAQSIRPSAMFYFHCPPQLEGE